MKSLDRKEALLLQLRRMNSEAQRGMHTDKAMGQNSQDFQNSYAIVVGQLKQVGSHTIICGQ